MRMLLIAWTSVLALVTCSLGEKTHFRGRPSSLATDDPPALRLPISAAQPQSFMSMAKGMFTQPSYTGFFPEENFKAWTDVKEFSVMNHGEILVTFCIWLVLYTLGAWYYQTQVRFFVPVEEEAAEEEKREHYKDFQEFRSGLCDCMAQPDICFWSFFCPGLRWADTMSKLGIHGFWSGFWGLTTLYIISFFPIATGICFSIIAAYMTYHRQEFRKVFDFEEQGGMTWVTDCFSYCCCMSCAVAQEARQCREAVAVVHPAINPATPKGYPKHAA